MNLCFGPRSCCAVDIRFPNSIQTFVFWTTWIEKLKQKLQGRFIYELSSCWLKTYYHFSNSNYWKQLNQYLMKLHTTLIGNVCIQHSRKTHEDIQLRKNPSQNHSIQFVWFGLSLEYVFYYAWNVSIHEVIFPVNCLRIEVKYIYLNLAAVFRCLAQFFCVPIIVAEMKESGIIISVIRSKMGWILPNTRNIYTYIPLKNK